MKNDSTTTFLNFVLAALVILGVVFALMNIWRTRDLRRMQPQLQQQLQTAQVVNMKVQALLQDVTAFNATAKNPDLARILQAVQTPAPAAK